MLIGSRTAQAGHPGASACLRLRRALTISMVPIQTEKNWADFWLTGLVLHAMLCLLQGERNIALVTSFQVGRDGADCRLQGGRAMQQ
jgi:hypothetical protein